MRPLKVKAKVIEEYNDSLNNGKLVELDSIVELDYGRFELLKNKGKVEEYKEPAKPLIKKED
jgi:hypothetical protein